MDRMQKQIFCAWCIFCLVALAVLMDATQKSFVPAPQKDAIAASSRSTDNSSEHIDANLYAINGMFTQMTVDVDLTDKKIAGATKGLEKPSGVDESSKGYGLKPFGNLAPIEEPSLNSGVCTDAHPLDCLAGRTPGSFLASTIPNSASFQIGEIHISSKGEITFPPDMQPSEAAKQFAGYLKMYMQCEPVNNSASQKGTDRPPDSESSPPASTAK